jgi:hypothetical protein
MGRSADRSSQSLSPQALCGLWSMENYRAILKRVSAAYAGVWFAAIHGGRRIIKQRGRMLNIQPQALNESGRVTSRDRSLARWAGACLAGSAVIAICFPLLLATLAAPMTVRPIVEVAAAAVAVAFIVSLARTMHEG